MPLLVQHSRQLHSHILGDHSIQRMALCGDQFLSFSLSLAMNVTAVCLLFLSLAVKESLVLIHYLQRSRNVPKSRLRPIVADELITPTFYSHLTTFTFFGLLIGIYGKVTLIIVIIFQLLLSDRKRRKSSGCAQSQN